MSKKVTIGAKPTNKSAQSSADEWAEGLRRAIKMQCASRGAKIADEVRELLLQKYGNL